jgi:hypothetical protein
LYRSDEHDRIRATARRFEEALPADKRKRLGQFFTGVTLGKLLAHLALDSDTQAVLDPMAGHGDLLDATSEAASERGISLERLDGIEIDSHTAGFCRERLEAVVGPKHTEVLQLVCGSAFDPAVLAQLPQSRYGLVITNPPYVRYQSQKDGGANGVNATRKGLRSIISKSADGPEQPIWDAIAKGYSGLADLSVASWILAALMVRPLGRLALVVPATWRSRDYGDVIRYLMLRCFRLEYIVEDTQPGWFSDALVRTHLIVAQRLMPDEIKTPLSSRTAWPAARWVQIAPSAANRRSLVGAAFDNTIPEAAFLRWLQMDKSSTPGIKVRAFPLAEERSSVASRAAQRPWHRELESSELDLPLFSSAKVSAMLIPEPMRDILGDQINVASLVTLGDCGIQVGQGLRTGCNRFFYVDACSATENGIIRIRASPAFDNREYCVPQSALCPVLRHQSEVRCIEGGQLPAGRVLALRQWVLPEDAVHTKQAEDTYRKLGEIPPQEMPEELADFVRCAAQTVGDEEHGRRIPELSAIRTNVRPHTSKAASPRFWYMLPDFKPRHIPDAFVARIITKEAWVECNLDEPILIDANFSTF